MSRHRMKTWVLVGVVVASMASLGRSSGSDSPREPAVLVLGLAAAPEYDGADTAQAVPLVVSRFYLGEQQVRIAGTQVRLGIVEQGQWSTGPLLDFVAPRDDSVSDARLARFEVVDLSFEAGGFIGYQQAIGQLDEGLLEVSLALQGPVSGGWEGLSMTLDMEYSWAVNFMWRMAVGGALTVVDDDYALSRFGVTSTDSARSGLLVFESDSGLIDSTIALRSIVSFSPAWGLFTRLAYTRLLQSAADSPIVTETGSADQWFVGIGAFRNLSE